METIFERTFIVHGHINCRYAADGAAITNDLADVEIELWRKNPANITFLGKGITDADGNFTIEFELTSPNPIITDGEITDTFIRAYYEGVPVEVDEVIEIGDIGSTNLSGTIWRNGSGVPANTLGLNGDYYLNTANGNVYQRQLGVYVEVINIKGATGPAGATGAAGATGPTGPTGATGAAGTPGVKGADGRTIHKGTGAPSPLLGGEGDIYIDTANKRLYGPKTSVWDSSYINLVGPTGSAGPKGDTGNTGATGPAGTKGDDGTDGRNGTKWYYGTSEDPNASDGGLPGDYYLNTNTGNLYLMAADSSYGLIGNFGSGGSSGPEYRPGTVLTFDKQATYGKEDAPETGNISIDPDSIDDNLNVPGVSVVVVHVADGGPPGFDDKFFKIAGSMDYSMGRVNYITCTFRTNSLILYKIEFIE